MDPYFARSLTVVIFAISPVFHVEGFSKSRTGTKCKYVFGFLKYSARKGLIKMEASIPVKVTCTLHASGSPIWLSMGLLEISRVTWKIWHDISRTNFELPPRIDWQLTVHWNRNVLESDNNLTDNDNIVLRAWPSTTSVIGPWTKMNEISQTTVLNEFSEEKSNFTEIYCYGDYKPALVQIMWRHQTEAFSATGLLCREFTGHRWIPLTKASDAELWCFLWSATE